MSGRGGGGGGRGRGKGSPKPKAKATAKKKPQGDDSSMKSCKRCDKEKSITMCFNAKQCICKTCVLGDKALTRVAENEGEQAVQELKAMRAAKDQKPYQALHKKYMAECATVTGAPKPGSRGAESFSFVEAKQELFATSGTRTDRPWKMMTEHLYFEEAANTYMGNLTGKEMKDNWQQWKDDPSWPRDEEGPRGAQQLKVYIGKIGSDYMDTGNKKLITGTISKKKDANADDVAKLAKATLSGHDDTRIIGNASSSMEEFLSDASKTMVGKTGFDGLGQSEAGMTLQSLRPEKKQKVKKGTEVEGVKKEENDDEDSSEENRVLAQDEPKVQTPRRKYGDYDRKRGGMLSSWVSSMDQLKSTSDDLLGDMSTELGRDKVLFLEKITNKRKTETNNET